ncbi:acyltransferase [Uliginosibacterium sp. TH139]|uniref:acyltransferase family protein n=1 Tax=Uliginosibacterium sp. TH139 TaxID=2067453 RepID=UPI000C7BB164|nr:acyltransferase [Uliginosibacterium sp. TH139]PLK50688.1 hypothetical protein C0V76_02425 [Uliginosibacterium sp. TH139]
MAPPETHAATPARLAWLDAARGIGIVLVVLGHILGGLRDAGLIERSGFGAHLFYAIYSFHMPLFFWLAGSLVDARLAKGCGRFLQATLIGVVWPYFLWGFLQSLANHLGSAYTNHQYPFDAQRLISFLWQPPAQFWFLYALFLLHLLALLSRHIPRGLCLGAASALSLAALWAWPESSSILVWTAMPAWAYFAGCLLGNAPLWPGEAALRRVAPVLVPLLLLACGTVSILVQDHGDAPGLNLPILPATLAGVGAVILACRCWGQHLSGLQCLGQFSMSIYVLHVLIVAGTRIALVKLLHIEALWLILPSQLLLGIGVPLALAALARRWNINRLLGLG